MRRDSNNSPHLLAVAILAAGASSRMGQAKLLLPWGATSVLGHQISIWQLLGAGQIGVVCAARDDAIQAELDRLGFPPQNRILNQRPEDEMFSSIRCASGWDGWRAGLTHWTITLGDQPHLRLETLQAVVELSAGEPEKICQPRRLGHLRHPVIMPKSLFQHLKDARVSTLKEFLAGREIASCEVDDPGLDLDIDEPEDYKKALALLVEQQPK